jgi:baculoviral IAP repeat-containing protein 6
MPWERNLAAASSLPSVPGGVIDSDDATTLSDQAVILSQLNVYMALLEEVQCRYSLACKNLTSLLSSVDVGNSSSSQYFFKRGKRTDEDTRIIQTYNECCQLQVCYFFVRKYSGRKSMPY